MNMKNTKFVRFDVYTESDPEIILLSAINSVTTDDSSNVTSHPVSSGMTISDHIYKNPGTVSVSGSYQNNREQFRYTKPMTLKEFEELFTNIRDSGYICDILEFTNDAENCIFKAYNNYALTHTSFTHNINTIDFTFTFTELIIIGNTTEVQANYSNMYNIEAENYEELRFVNRTKQFINMNSVADAIVLTYNSLIEAGTDIGLTQLYSIIGTAIASGIYGAIEGAQLGGGWGALIGGILGVFAGGTPGTVSGANQMQRMLDAQKNLLDVLAYLGEELPNTVAGRNADPVRGKALYDDFVDTALLFQNFIYFYEISVSESNSKFLISINSVSYIIESNTETDDDVQKTTIILRDLDNNELNRYIYNSEQITSSSLGDYSFPTNSAYTTCIVQNNQNVAWYRVLRNGGKFYVTFSLIKPEKIIECIASLATVFFLSDTVPDMHSLYKRINEYIIVTR